MTEIEFINKLKTIITASEQINIFSNDNCIDKIVEESVRYLRFKGFKVIEPKKFKSNIKNIDDLIKYFYLLINAKHSNEYALSYNLGKDRSIAKKFVVNRMAVTGASKEYALNECGEIISTIFEHYDEFKFKYALNFSILGQKKSKWITDKAIQLMNKKLREKEEKETEILQNKAIESQDIDNLGFNDLDDLLAKMEAR